jgi:methyl-accepting chemotaxis protein
MTTDHAMPSSDLPDATPPAGRAAPLRLAAGGLLAAGTLLLGWQGGVLGAAGVAGTALLVLWLLRHVWPSHAGAAATTPSVFEPPRVSGGRVGAEVMVSQVVPVWSKQLDITRNAAVEGLAQLLDSFAQLSGALGTLSSQLDNNSPTLEVGAIDKALADNSPAQAALAALLAPSLRAFAQRDAAMAELNRCAEALQELRHLGRQAREVAKHTRLVAFNASIESNRGTQGAGSGNGSQAVANETRMLAARMGEVGEQVERAVSLLDKSLHAERLRAAVGSSTEDELKLEVQVRAREALAGLVGALGNSMGNSAEVKQASQTLSAQLDQAFVNFQFGDRLSQMLAIVGTDMGNFARWVSANPYATQSDAAEWLANLESSYTMEEQRSQHHGNVHIDRGSEIEFF